MHSAATTGTKENPFKKASFSGTTYRETRPNYVKGFYELCKQLISNKGDNETGPTSTVAIDVGCGPGIASLSLADVTDKVLAVDDSEQQLAAAPSHPRVEYRNCVALDLIEQCEQHSANLIFFGQSMHWVGPADGSKVSKHVLSKQFPSFMVIGGFHYGYLADVNKLPQDAIDFFSSSTSPVPVYEVKIPKDFYENHTKLTRVEYYAAHREASDIFYNHIDSLPWSEKSEMKTSEFYGLVFPFKYHKKLYYHRACKQSVSSVAKILKSWSAAQASGPEELSKQVKEVEQKMMTAMGLEDPEDTVVFCQISFCIFFSDNYALDEI